MDQAFTLLIDTWVEGVYRFHLARRGDWLDAETLTAETFLDAYLAGVEEPAALMRLALARQARSHGSAGLHSAPSSDTPLPNRVAGRLSEPEYTDADTEQDRMLRRAQITALRDYWPTLLPAQADAVALACFAGLDLPAIARTLRTTALQAATWLDSQAGVVPRLSELGELIRVPEVYKSELKAALNQVTVPGWRGRRLEQLRQGLNWLSYKVRPGMGQFPWLAPVGFVLLLAGYGVWSTARLTNRSLAATPGPTVQVTAAAPLSSLPPVGLLIPPDPSVCRQWASRLAAITGGQTAVDPESTFNDPAGTGTNYFGKGCFITINAWTSAENAASAQKTMLAQLAKDGFKQSKQFSPSASLTPDGSSQPVRYRGQGYSLTRQNDQVVFEWLSGVTAAAEPAQAYPMPVYTTLAEPQLIYFGIASREAQPVLEGFTAAWAKGADSVTQYFAAPLRSRLPDAAALDRSAGIVRSTAKNLTISWKLIENQGDSLRLALSLAQVSELALPSAPITPVQIILTRENGRLAISSLASGVLFNPSTDALVLVDSQGQIYSQPLDGGQRTNLGDPGFYPVSLQPTGSAAPSLPPPRISPDGNWLFVEPPGGGPAPAYLIRMDGKNVWGLQARPVLFDWSPDSTRYVFVADDAPNQLRIGRIGGSAPAVVVAPGPIQSIAWSPLADWIAFAYEYISQTQGVLSIARLSTASNGALDTVWSTPWAAGTAIPANAMTWTADQNELWFLPARVSIHFEDRTAYALMRRPDDQATEDLLATALGTSTSTTGQAALSPDGNWFAQVVDNPSPTALFMGHFWVGVRPANVSASGFKFSFFPGVEKLAWTGDNQSLIAVRNPSGPPSPASGYVFDRFNPVTQETATLGSDAAAKVFLGLKSGLIAASQPAPMTAKIERIPSSTANPKWVSYQDEALHLSIEFPERWSIWVTPPGSPALTGQPAPAEASLTLANFIFKSPLGFTSLNRGDVSFHVTRTTFDKGQNPASWLTAQVPQGFLAPAFLVARQQGYWVARSDNEPFLKTLLFTTPGAGYRLDWYSFLPQTDLVIDDILDALQIIP